MHLQSFNFFSQNVPALLLLLLLLLTTGSYIFQSDERSPGSQGPFLFESIYLHYSWCQFRVTAVKCLPVLHFCVHLVTFSDPL